ncbi:MAG: hydrogenase maturation nickel metallochaperone HypA [Propionibacteriaceae bacterium]|nr:hydrogenase maturation nickel metallochaperone HypA [Propionibacteriaceae bacterium]
MHELALCRSISGIVTRAAKGAPVARIALDVGELRQVVPATLEYSWDIVSAGGPLAGSKLEINHIPGVINCAVCGQDTRLRGAPILRCASCGSADVTVRSGEEFLVRSIDVEVSNGSVSQA